MSTTVEETRTGEYFKAWRERLGLSQAQAAKYLETPKRAIENWEQNVRRPPAYLYRALRDIEREINQVEAHPKEKF